MHQSIFILFTPFCSLWKDIIQLRIIFRAKYQAGTLWSEDYMWLWNYVNGFVQNRTIKTLSGSSNFHLLSYFTPINQGNKCFWPEILSKAFLDFFQSVFFRNYVIFSVSFEPVGSPNFAKTSANDLTFSEKLCSV